MKYRIQAKKHVKIWDSEQEYQTKYFSKATTIILQATFSGFYGGGGAFARIMCRFARSVKSVDLGRQSFDYYFTYLCVGIIFDFEVSCSILCMLFKATSRVVHLNNEDVG